MSSYTESLNQAKSLLGSFEKIGSVCGLSGKAVSKWAKNGRPPRTEYTGETRYAEAISNAVGGKVRKEALLPVIKQTIAE